MQEVEKNLASFNEAVIKAAQQIKLAELEQDLRALEAQMRQPDFWDDSASAQEIVKKQAALAARIKPWQELVANTKEITELAKLQDKSLAGEIVDQLDVLEKQFESLKTELKFAGPYDNNSAIVSIHAGAGGTDAQDWAEILMRMYIRWAEKNNYGLKTIEQSSGEEAGIKSATFEINGSLAYGKLKGEHGVHRLVRLSPFNADNLRQTSFAKVEVLPKIERDDTVAIDEKDIKVDVYRAGGHGGQSVNTTDSAVRVTHLPTGITVSIQNERSQLQNKETALTILRSRLAQLQLEQHKEKLEELKGPNQSAEWGNQIRSYVLHPYKQVKDLRTKYETTDPDAVLGGNLDGLIQAYLEQNYSSEA